MGLCIPSCNQRASSRALFVQEVCIPHDAFVFCHSTSKSSINAGQTLFQIYLSDSTKDGMKPSRASSCQLLWVQDRNTDRGRHCFIEARIEQMVAMLASSRNNNAAKHHSGTANEQARLALEAQAIIERMLDEGRAPTINELTNVLFVSRSHLCSAFLHETGQSIGHYAKTRRIERAKTLIASGCSVAQIATRLGWTRCSAFSQAFKQSTGVSPTEWRNLNLDSPNSKTYSSTRTIQSQ